jgi:predicted nucleotidyltransferase/HEPN domain-containing protein
MAAKNDQALKAARRFVRAVERAGIRLEAAYLFGSHAAGTPHADSDIDIALVSKDLTGSVADLDKIRLALGNSRIENIRFHPRDFRDENPLVWEIKTKGVPLVGQAARHTKSLPVTRALNYQRVVAYWLKAAREDWRMASGLFAEKHYSYALVFARLYLEKTLKALVVHHTRAHAPIKYRLLELAELTGLSLNTSERALLARAEDYRREAFENPDAQFVRRKHTRKFVNTELDYIQELGKYLTADLRSHPRPRAI